MVAASAERRFFFVHVMKTGGTSFVFQLLRNFDADAVYPHQALDRFSPTDVEPYASVTALEQLTPERRAGIRVYAGHFPFAAREAMGSDVVTLTLLREPVDRTVSVLKHFKRLWPRYRELSLDAIYDDEFVFRHFCEHFQTRVFALTPADDTRSFASAVDFVTMRTAMEDASRQDAALGAAATIVVDADRLERAKGNLAVVDALGVQDAFGAFIAELRDRFHWWPSGEAIDAHANVSSEPWEAGGALRSRIDRDSAYDRELYEHAHRLIVK
jgi:hypothetical protein